MRAFSNDGIRHPRDCLPQLAYFYFPEVGIPNFEASMERHSGDRQISCSRHGHSAAKWNSTLIPGP